MKKEENVYVKTIHGGPGEVRAWLNKQPGFVNGTSEYYISPIDKDGKEIIIPVKRRNLILEDYPTDRWRLYRSTNIMLANVPKKQPFLDMGARANPHPYATDATEVGPRRWVNQQVREEETEGRMNLDLFRNRLKKDLKYHFEFDYNRRKLPYPDNHFEVVYSRGSMTYAATQHAYKEVYRVLKHGGKLILDTGASERSITKTIDTLKKYGFKNVTFKQRDAYKLENVKGVHFSGLIIGVK